MDAELHVDPTRLQTVLVEDCDGTGRILEGFPGGGDWGLASAFVFEHLGHIAGWCLEGLEQALNWLLLLDEQILLQVLLEFWLVLVQGGCVVLIAVDEEIREAVQVRVVILGEHGIVVATATTNSATIHAKSVRADFQRLLISGPLFCY